MNATTADRLQSFVTANLETLVERHLPAWRIPGIFAGHPVEPDVAADLAFTLAHLHDLGVTEVAGTPTVEAIARVLWRIDGARTHTFFSYRVAETLARFGPFGDNDLIGDWSPSARANLMAAVDSTDWIGLLDEGLPRNYAAVLARCELARRELALEIDDTVFEALVGRTREMLARNPLGFLDDSTHGVGRIDIYTVDVWHFTEPLATLLGDIWFHGAQAAAELVEKVGSPDGSAITWGRSTGALAVALTLEMAGLVLGDQRFSEGSDPAPGAARRDLWWARADTAATAMQHWFADGLTSAHQHRSPYGYRGPFRRLQMTLDLLGKLAWAVGRLSRVEEPARRSAPAHIQTDELIALEPDRASAVWAFQGGEVGFVVPFVGATTSDYLAAPRRPGLFEVPVDSHIACWVPTVVARDRTWSSCGVPASVNHVGGGVTAEWAGFEPLGALDPAAGADRLAGTASLSYEVADRTITMSMELTFADTPAAVGVVVPEVEDRPLRVEVLDPGSGAGSTTAHLDTIDTSGVAQWRSFTNELPVVHQVDLEVGPRVSVSIAVTPTLRVASSCHGHHYDRCLYGPLETERIAVSRADPLGPLGDPAGDPGAIDLYHLHWPEWMAFDDLEAHRAIAHEWAAHDVPVVWTAHNLTPHDKRPEVHDPIYQLWAQRVAAVIHHSRWGEQRMRERYDFPGSVRHTVIPHGHFGELYPTAHTPTDTAAAALGLPPAPIRIGILGAPRRERDVSGFLEAFAASQTELLQVCCWSLGPDDRSPADARIAVAEPYEMVDARTYGLRLAACDVIALPYDPDGEMLATGVASDVVGLARAALVSEWPYLTEVLGDAGIPMGRSRQSMISALDSLTPAVVERAARVAASLQPAQSWERSASLTAELFEVVLADRH